MVQIDRNGSSWEIDTFDGENIEVCKGGKLYLEAVNGKIHVKETTFNEMELRTALSLVNEFRDKIQKRI